MRIKNNFTTGITNSDISWRLLPNGTMVDAENFFVTITGGSDVGQGKNTAGNVLVAPNNFVGGKSYGVGKESASNKVYYFVKADEYDYLMEYDSVTNANVIVLQSTTGTRLNLKEGERIINIDVYIDPEGNGNLIAWSGDSNPPRIGNIERMKTWGLDGFTAEEIMLIKKPPTYSPILEPIISTENVEANYLSDKFICFSTRYKYKDGYYSAISSWSKYFFEPYLYKLDFETFENLGMINSFNSVNISFDTGEREVIAIDLLFKFANETDIYKVDTFIKKDENWLDNSIQTLEFNNSKVYGILPVSEYFRSFDNVPEEVKAQTPIGNRIAFGNYKEGKNLVDINNKKVIIDYSLSLNSSPRNTTLLNTTSVTENYNFDSIPVSLLKGKLRINLTGIALKKNSAITINFKITNNDISRFIDFTKVFKFNITRDFVDLTDLINNSNITSQLDSFFLYFLTNGGIVKPSNNLDPIIVLKQFVITNTGSFLEITLPVIKYEIDNSPSPNTFVRDYFIDNSSFANFSNQAVITSLKSYRSYEICMIYRDLQCRKTTALTSSKNTLFIPNKNAINRNIINVSIPSTQKPPKWAKTYKFGIKMNKGIYETIPINIFFVDGIFRWIKIDGENKNKLKEGDILIVKRDGVGFLENPIKVKVLEYKQQPENFLPYNSVNIIEPSGLYAKIKALNFEMEYATNEFLTLTGIGETDTDFPFVWLGAFTDTNINGIVTDKSFSEGSTVDISFKADYSNEDPRILFQKSFTADQNYANFEEFFNTQIAPNGFESTSHPNQSKFFNVILVRGLPVIIGGQVVVNPNPAGFLYLRVIGTESGWDGATFINQISGPFFTNSAKQYGRIYATIAVRSVKGLFIFENTAKEIKNDIFYETPEIYNIVNGEHEMSEHLLKDTYNCFCQGNGVESYQVRDAFNEKHLSIDFSPTAVSEDEYGEVNRYADITYSGIYNSTTNVNRLNEFNLSLGNFKDDIEKSYGAIIKLRGKDTDLEVYQSNRVSIVYYGKNLLQNVDGTTNLIQVENVLNQQNTYDGENGISSHPESFDFESINEYFADVKRGAVCKKSNNGVFEISLQGQKNYFRKLFRNNKINNIIGRFDQFHDYFILNVKYNDTEYVTWVYSDADNGWLGRIKFNPEDMIRINNDFISFQNGNIYKHNQEKDGVLDNFNTFYGTQYPSKFSFVVNDEPSMRKIHKAISMESTDAWDIILETNLNNGYINKEDFAKQEGVFYSYIRNQNLTIDTALIGANSGIGNCIINGLNLEFSFDLEDNVSIGDEVRNSDLELVGTILNKTNNSLSLNAVNNINDGDYVLCAKPQSAEGNNLVGHSMLVTCTLDTNKKTEVFAIGTEVVISSPT